MLSRKQIWKKICKKVTIQNEEETIYNLLKKTHRKVSFDNVVNVTLICHYNDYKRADIVDDIWYSSEDYKEMQKNFTESKESETTD